MEHAHELLLGLVMLLTTAGFIAAFITFYNDDASRSERSGSEGHGAPHNKN